MAKKKNSKKKNSSRKKKSQPEEKQKGGIRGLIAKIPSKVRIKGGRSKVKNKYGTVESSYKDLEVGK